MFFSEFALVRIVLKRSAQKSHRVPRNPPTVNGPLGQLGPPVQQTAEEVLKRAKEDAIIPHLKTEDNIAEGTTSNTKNATSTFARTTSSYKPLNGAPTIIFPTATITRKGSESLAKLLSSTHSKSKYLLKTKRKFVIRINANRRTTIKTAGALGLTGANALLAVEGERNLGLVIVLGAIA